MLVIETLKTLAEDFKTTDTKKDIWLKNYYKKAKRK